MKATRTIIDILRKGNQELFHSSMIAWMLDPQGEHGFGSAFLEGFAERVAERGDLGMKSALQASSVSSVATETTTYKRRYDIVLHIGQSMVVIENKTKSLGGEPQFDKYEADASVLVALGLTDISFDKQVRTKFPVITYGDVLEIIDSLGEPPNTDFGVLVRHYAQFLRRELDLLRNIESWSASGAEDVSKHILNVVDAAVGFTKNDERFLNLYFLERFVEFLFNKKQWKDCRWETDKNMRSGVWLALFNPGEPPSPFEFDARIRKFCDDNSAGLWFHTELWSGVLAKNDADTAGMIQIRCHTKQDNSKALSDFRSMWQLAEDEWFVKSVKKTDDTFYLVARSLQKGELRHDRLESQLVSFMRRFGSINIA